MKPLFCNIGVATAALNIVPYLMNLTCDYCLIIDIDHFPLRRNLRLGISLDLLPIFINIYDKRSLLEKGNRCVDINSLIQSSIDLL